MTRNGWTNERLIEVNQKLKDVYKNDQPLFADASALYELTYGTPIKIVASLMMKKPFKFGNYMTAYVVYVMTKNKKMVLNDAVEQNLKWLSLMNNLEVVGNISSTTVQRFGEGSE